MRMCDTFGDVRIAQHVCIHAHVIHVNTRTHYTCTYTHTLYMCTNMVKCRYAHVRCTTFGDMRFVKHVYIHTHIIHVQKYGEMHRYIHTHVHACEKRSISGGVCRHTYMHRHIQVKNKASGDIYFWNMETNETTHIHTHTHLHTYTGERQSIRRHIFLEHLNRRSDMHTFIHIYIYIYIYIYTGERQIIRRYIFLEH